MFHYHFPKPKKNWQGPTLDFTFSATHLIISSPCRSAPHLVAPRTGMWGTSGAVQRLPLPLHLGFLGEDLLELGGFGFGQVPGVTEQDVVEPRR